jgi:hypothetical protein
MLRPGGRDLQGSAWRRQCLQNPEQIVGFVQCLPTIGGALQPCKLSKFRNNIMNRNIVFEQLLVKGHIL